MMFKGHVAAVKVFLRTDAHRNLLMLISLTHFILMRLLVIDFGPSSLLSIGASIVIPSLCFLTHNPL